MFSARDFCFIKIATANIVKTNCDLQIGNYSSYRQDFSVIFLRFGNLLHVALNIAAVNGPCEWVIKTSKNRKLLVRMKSKTLRQMNQQDVVYESFCMPH